MKTMRSALALRLLITSAIFAHVGWSEPASSEVILRFEGQSEIVERPTRQGARVDERSGTVPSSATAAGAQDVRLGDAVIQYEGGTSTQRAARIVADPSDANNRVLEFWVAQPNVEVKRNRDRSKSRVQMNVYGNQGVAELYLSTKLYIHPDFGVLKEYPRPVSWMTISEWWNNAGWTDEAHPFRISVHLRKPTVGAGEIRFAVEAQRMSGRRSGVWDTVVWEQVDTDYAVPLGQWIRLEYYFREGNAGTGRFKLAVTPDNGSRTVIFDIVDFTHHPLDPQPDGLSHFNPIKLYTSGPQTEFLRERGRALRLLWDDVEMVPCGKSSGPSACLSRWER